MLWTTLLIITPNRHIPCNPHDAQKVSVKNRKQVMNPEHEKAFTVARIYFQSNLNDEAASAYVKQRGLSPAALRAFEIGYAPNQWRGLVDHFSSHKIRMAAHDA